MSVYSTKFTRDEYILNNFRDMSDDEILKGKVHWKYLSCQWRYRLPEDFILRFKDYLDFYELSNRKNFSKDILENVELQNYWNILQLLRSGTKYVPQKAVSWIQEYSGKLNPHTWAIFSNLELERLDDLIKNNPECIDWEVVSERPDLPLDFIKLHLTKLDLETFIMFSKSFKKLKKIDKEFANMIKVLWELNKWLLNL